MVDPKTLVVAADEPDLDELGDRAAYVRPARLADALTNGLRYRRLRLVGVQWKLAGSDEFRADLVSQS